VHRHRQVANPLHFDAIGDTAKDELRGGFPFQRIDQKDDGDVLLHLTKNVQHLGFLPIRAGVLGYHEVKRLRTEPLRELLGSHNYFA